MTRKYNTNDFWMLSHLEAGLPFETSLYVAKITAMSVVANNPERFGYGKLTRDAPIALAKVDVPAGTGLRAVASAAGLELDKLKALNPHILRGRVPPGTQPPLGPKASGGGQTRVAGEGNAVCTSFCEATLAVNPSVLGLCFS